MNHSAIRCLARGLVCLAALTGQIARAASGVTSDVSSADTGADPAAQDILVFGRSEAKIGIAQAASEGSVSGRPGDTVAPPLEDRVERPPLHNLVLGVQLRI